VVTFALLSPVIERRFFAGLGFAVACPCLSLLPTT